MLTLKQLFIRFPEPVKFAVNFKYVRRWSGAGFLPASALSIYIYKKSNSQRLEIIETRPCLEHDSCLRVPALPAWRHGAGGVNCAIKCNHVRPDALVSRAKLSHDTAGSSRALTGLDALAPPAPPGPAIGGCRNLGFL